MLHRIKHFRQCFDSDGKVNVLSWVLYRRYIRHIRKKRRENRKLKQYNRNKINITSTVIKKRAHPIKRSCFRLAISKLVTEDGTVSVMTPLTSPWYATYILGGSSTDPKFEQKFRRCFCCSFSMFPKLLGKIKNNKLFFRWTHRPDAFWRFSAPIELLLLGSLRYLGRNCTFDDLEELTGISENLHRHFFHVFLTYGSTTFYKEQVYIPDNINEWQSHMKEFTDAGLSGCVASMDATHVGMQRCPYARWNEHKGPKLSMPARTYNICVNHRRRILHTTPGHPGRWNDKTIVFHDNFVHDLHRGKVLQNNTFKLFEKNKDGVIVSVDYRGAYVITDNGYLKWPCTMPPYKETPFINSLRWSKWVESMRKDVECCFGILKGRFRILKNGVRVHGIEVTDKIWRTCCSLHNFLLTEDGMDDCWINGVPTSYENEDDLVDDDENNCEEDIVQTIESLTSTLNDHNIPDIDFNDTSNNVNDIVVPAASESVRIVRSLEYEYFRERLVEHFTILFENNSLVWPSRMPQQNALQF